MKARHEPVGQSVAREKDMPCFREPVLQRVVPIAKTRRDGHVALPFQVGMLVVRQAISYNCSVPRRQ